MSVNYLEMAGDKVIKVHHNCACYSNIFSGKVQDKTTEFILYEPILQFKDDVVKAWVAMLNSLGFRCKYLGVKPFKYKATDDSWQKKPIIGDYHTFVIPLKTYKWKNHLCSTLTLLRYLFEINNYNTMLDVYFDIRKKEPKIPAFQALQMSFIWRSGSGHTCHMNAKHHFLKLKELYANFAKYKTLYESGSSLFECWENRPYYMKLQPSNNYKKIHKIMQRKNLFVYVVGGAKQYANWLPNVKTVNNLEEADLVLFTGGEDVDPSLYGEPKGQRTGSNLVRDMQEKAIYEKATELGLKKLGICRGSQFLCVMSGGKLVQHQENPHAVHKIKTGHDYALGEEITITSTHHQAAYPYNLQPYKYHIIGWTENISKIHLDGNDKELSPKKECEIVHYFDSNSLGIQGHPEFLDYQRDPANQRSLELLREIFNNFIN